jgi:hypothetical protein
VGLVAAIEGVPELREIPKGAGCSYALDEANLSLHDFVAMMNCFPDEGDDDAADWPPAVAAEWSAVEGQIDDSWVRGCAPLIQRLVTIERVALAEHDADRRIVVVWALFEGKAVPIVAGGENPVGIAEIASHSWAVDNDTAPISSAGGSTLIQVARDLAFSKPWGDDAEMSGAGFLLDFPAGDPEARAAWLAE